MNYWVQWYKSFSIPFVMPAIYKWNMLVFHVMLFENGLSAQLGGNAHKNQCQIRVNRQQVQLYQRTTDHMGLTCAFKDQLCTWANAELHCQRGKSRRNSLSGRQFLPALPSSPEQHASCCIPFQRVQHTLSCLSGQLLWLTHGVAPGLHFLLAPCVHGGIITVLLLCLGWERKSCAPVKH